MNVQNLTLEQISVAILFIVGLIGGIKYLKDAVKDTIEKFLGDQFKTVNDKLDAMQKLIKTLDTQSTKNFLVRYLADIERGDNLYHSEKERFWEAYDHYDKELKENSFIKKWVENLEREGKLEARPAPKEE